LALNPAIAGVIALRRAKMIIAMVVFGHVGTIDFDDFKLFALFRCSRQSYVKLLLNKVEAVIFTSPELKFD